jgi:hypothetical protein
MQGRADERLRPPVQLANPVPGFEVWGASAVLELSVLLRLHSETPRNLTDGESAPLTVTPKEVRERCHERSLERAVHNPSCPGRTLDVRAGLVSARRERRARQFPPQFARLACPPGLGSPRPGSGLQTSSAVMPSAFTMARGNNSERSSSALPVWGAGPTLCPLMSRSMMEVMSPPERNGDG